MRRPHARPRRLTDQGDIARLLHGDIARLLHGARAPPRPRPQFDLVAIGRALLVHPRWPEKICDGRHAELRNFDRSALATLS